MGELPYFEAAKKQYGDKVEFLVLSKPGAPHEQSFSQHKGYTMTFGRDIDGFAAYGFQVIPSTVFINAQGKPVDQHIGGMDGEQLAAAISRIL